MMQWAFFKDMGSATGISIYLIAAIFLLVKTYPVLKNYTNDRRIFKKDELDKMFQLFSENKYFENRFLYEQVIEYKYNKALAYREIEFILGLESPSEAFNDYIISKEYLAFTPQDSKPYLKGLCNRRAFRQFFKFINFISYFFFAMIGFGLIPIIGIKLIGVSPWFWAASLFFSLYCLVAAYLFVRDFWAIKAGERFMMQVDKLS